jgi:two-component system response regulator YesN
MENPYAGCTVLVADDDEDIRFLIGSDLRNAGAIVVEAASGTAAMEFLDTNPQIDVLITDMQMPNGDGLTLLRWVKLHLPHVRTIVLTGNVLFEQAEDLGADHVFIKPCRTGVLRNAVRNLCRKTA